VVETARESRWSHRLAVLLAAATFPLLWLGGMVTTYQAGMAVPDWPSTYGYNLFLYPWQSWLAGPWDLFLEHGHRLLGALVGVLTIGLAAVLWRCEPRRWLRWLGAGALAGVCLQGVLGGLRVVLDQRQLALLHGCLGPLFFALCVALAVVTSRRWIVPPVLPERGSEPHLPRLAWLTVVLSYVQLVIGAHLRHMPADGAPGGFRALVFLHLLMAAVVALHVGLAVGRVIWSYRQVPALVWPAAWLVLLLVVQLGLGGGTWVVKYGWPDWSIGVPGAEGYTVLAAGWLQATVVTAHVATGSLLLGCSLVLALRSTRLLGVVWPGAVLPGAAALPFLPELAA